LDRTLGHALRTRGTDSENNFTLIRLAAASLVVYGHCFAFTGGGGTDVIRTVFGYRYAGDLGLFIFFSVSGFLVSASFERRPAITAFLKARALRLFPALLVFTTIIVFVVGAVLTDISIGDYFSSAQTWRFLGVNGTLLGFSPSLPGVMSGDRYPSLVGTLWTLWIESRFYLLVALFGSFGVLRSPAIASALLAVFAAIAFLLPAHMPLIGATPEGRYLAAFFGAGVAVYVFREWIPLRVDIFCIIALCIFLSRSLRSYEAMFGVGVVYGTFLIAFLPKLNSRLDDVSYGIYLYGWPVQKIIHLTLPSLGPYQLFIISMPIAIGLATLSWRVIEKPSLLLKKDWRRVLHRPEYQDAVGDVGRGRR